MRKTSLQKLAAAKWELVPYDFGAFPKALRKYLEERVPSAPQVRLASMVAIMPLSGCSGLDAWLRYNDGELSGCLITPLNKEVLLDPFADAVHSMDCPSPEGVDKTDTP